MSVNSTPLVGWCAETRCWCTPILKVVREFGLLLHLDELVVEGQVHVRRQFPNDKCLQQ